MYMIGFNAPVNGGEPWRRAMAESQSPLMAESLLLARPKGVEPLTFWSVARHSIQLSYGRTAVEAILVDFA